MKINFNQSAELIQATFQNEEDHLSFSKMCIAVVKNNVEKYTVGQANSFIKDNILKIAGLPSNPSANDVRLAMRRTNVREAVFEVIWQTVEDTLVSGWQADPFFMRYVEVKTVALGQINEFYMPDQTELMLSEVAASNHDIIRQRLGQSQTFNLKVKNYGAKVYMEVERYLMGSEDWSRLIGKISTAYTRLINNELYTLIMSAGANFPAPTQWNVTGALSAANHDEFVKLISDVSIASGSNAVIMGTKVALSGLRNLGDVDWISDEARADVYHTGRIGMFEGTEIVEIPQAFALRDTSTYLVDETKLLIMPGTIEPFIKMWYEGGDGIKEVQDRNVNADHTYEYELYNKMGFGVVLNTRFGTWTIE